MEVSVAFNKLGDQSSRPAAGTSLSVYHQEAEAAGKLLARGRESKINEMYLSMQLLTQTNLSTATPTKNHPHHPPPHPMRVTVTKPGGHALEATAQF